jgi:hypothetical protein
MFGALFFLKQFIASKFRTSRESDVAWNMMERWRTGPASGHDASHAHQAILGIVAGINLFKQGLVFLPAPDQATGGEGLLIVFNPSALTLPGVREAMAVTGTWKIIHAKT